MKVAPNPANPAIDLGGRSLRNVSLGPRLGPWLQHDWTAVDSWTGVPR